MKIIIVEDERKSLMGLTALIGQLEERWDIVGTAGNGEEGVRLIAREQPDVVITDVMMEQMDGLEMMEAVLNQGNECKFIVLSGFADFKFAQKAIQLGSVDYLLKPVTKKTLREVLERVEQKIREEKHQIRPSTFSEQELWERLYSVPEDAAESYLKELESRMAGRGVYLLMLKGDAGFTVSEETKWKEIMKYYLSGMTFHFFSGGRHKLFFAVESEELTRLEGQIREGLKRGKSLFHKPVVAVSYFLEGLKEFYRALKVMEDNSNWGLSVIQMDIINEEKLKAVECNKFIYPMETERNMIRHIGELDMAAVREDLREFEAYLKKQVYHYADIREAMLCMTVAILYEIRKTSYGIYEEISHLNVLEWVKTRISTDAYATMMLNILGEFKRYKDNVHHCNNPVINEILNIIEKEYKENILVEEMARRFNITPEYLSTLFVRELGIKYTAYCTQVKIEHAKKLLRNSNMKIYEVAEQSGYMDVKYFCKVFKKYTGKSPKEYIQM
ncbi:response regulator [Enterocloster sp. OA13]|uniref:response regulator transcription factor n=1 Tax=Enterocloster sp. OA13 TaxID=2914161 RepID=UPI0004715494|nr:response regulator [Enterocloster sp. OA13]